MNRTGGAIRLPRRWATIAMVPLAALMLLSGVRCVRRERAPRPNILWILWDTVRADHLSLYGYERSTTPFLDTWARDARVYDDCLSAANYTAPSHASFFTGLLTSQHGASNDHLYLDEDLTTIAELLSGAGYQTFLYSANPNISAEENFDQGFLTVEHPWSEKHLRSAMEILRDKVQPEDHSSGLPEKIRQGRVGKWDIKASGQLAEQALRDWLRLRRPAQPYFAFLNYMEAHRPYIPPREYRARMMTPSQVTLSYQIDRSWASQWSYTFGRADYSDEEIAVTAATYDAALAELDDLLRSLLTSLEADGQLENTIVVVTSDHGEHLGDHHMLGHQHSLYNALIHVPLVIRYPQQIAPGREPGPVMNYDLFPTLLELAGIEPPDAGGGAVSLLAPLAERRRISEGLGVFRDPFAAVQQMHPDWDPRPWDRELRALIEGRDKFIWSSNGGHELYDYRGDPREERDRAAGETDVVARLAQTVDGAIADLGRRAPADAAPEMPPAHRERLRSLGYIDVSAKPDTGAGKQTSGGE